MNEFEFQVSDAVHNPSHYVAGKYEVIDILEDWVQHAPDAVVGSLQWQCLKYLSRMWLKKNPLEDAEKCRWYLNRLINTIATEAYRND